MRRRRKSSTPAAVPSDRRHILYYARNADNGKSAVYSHRSTARHLAWSCETRERRLRKSRVRPLFAAGKLVAQRFDLERLALSGDRAARLDAMAQDVGDLFVSASDTETLVTAVARETAAQLAWVESARTATTFPSVSPVPRLESVAERLAPCAEPGGGGTSPDLWTMDLERGAFTV